jgi:hypothetical protein
MVFFVIVAQFISNYFVLTLILQISRVIVQIIVYVLLLRGI